MSVSFVSVTARFDRSLTCSKQQIWKQLIGHVPAKRERISLITAIFSDHLQVEMAEQLSGDDAQTFIDRVDGVGLRAVSCSKDKSIDSVRTSTFQVLDLLLPGIRTECVRYLYRVCCRHALLPKSLAVPLRYDQTELPLRHGGSADIWKGQCLGREVAAKVLKVCSAHDLGQITRVGFWWCS